MHILQEGNRAGRERKGNSGASKPPPPEAALSLQDLVKLQGEGLQPVPQHGTRTARGHDVLQARRKAPLVTVHS